MRSEHEDSTSGEPTGRLAGAEPHRASLPVPVAECRPFRLEVYIASDRAAVTAVGELDLASAGVLEGRLRDLHDAGFAHLVLDLQDVSFADCAGLRIVLAADRRAREAGRRFTVLGACRQVRQLFALTAADHQLEYAEQPALAVPATIEAMVA